MREGRKERVGKKKKSKGDWIWIWIWSGKVVRFSSLPLTEEAGRAGWDGVFETGESRAARAGERTSLISLTFSSFGFTTFPNNKIKN